MKFLLLISPVVIALAACFSAGEVGADQPFEQASEQYDMQFPRDHGSHPRFQTEWWYYTGQLVGPSKELFKDKADFAFQLTFFRRAERASEQLAWDQGFLAHGALLDLSKREFKFEKRLAGGGLRLAGASETGLRVWNRDWRTESTDKGHQLDFNLDGGRVRVRLLAAYPGNPILHGAAGYSRKGQCPSCASQYYSLPGMSIEGEVEIAGKITPVHGLAWMDHEFMSSALQEDQSGWDWFSLMFKDGRRLMLYNLRKRGGGLSFSSGTLVTEGRTERLSAEAFTVENLSNWTSPSGTTYPSSWRVRVREAAIDEVISPLYPNQEIRAADPNGITYWEGAVASASGKALGYVELTGYERALGATF